MKYILVLTLLSGCYSTSGVTSHGTQWQLGQAFASKDFSNYFNSIMNVARDKFENKSGVKTPDHVYYRLSEINVQWMPVMCSSTSGKCKARFITKDGWAYITVYRLDQLEQMLLHYLHWRAYGNTDITYSGILVNPIWQKLNRKVDDCNSCFSRR